MNENLPSFEVGKTTSLVYNFQILAIMICRDFTKAESPEHTLPPTSYISLNYEMCCIFEQFLNEFLYIPSKHRPLKSTFCSKRNFSICSVEEKLISLETALHFNIFFGTRAWDSTTFRIDMSYKRSTEKYLSLNDHLPSCSTSGDELKSEIFMFTYLPPRLQSCFMTS